MTESRRLANQLRYLLLVGLVGWIVSLYTLWHRAKVRAGVDLGASFCNINDSINCDAVALSKYSEVMGVSVSTLGLMFFAVVILLAFRGLKQVNQSPHHLGMLTKKFIFLMGILGTIASVVLFLVTTLKIGAFCLVCGIVYLISFSLLAVAWKINHVATKVQSEKLNSLFVLLLIAAIAVQLNFQPLVDYAAKQASSEASQVNDSALDPQMLREFNSETSYEIPMQNSPFTGPADAPVTIVEFSDFECPHCADHFKKTPQALAGFGDKVKLVSKNFPLDPACNTGGSHRKACMAAWAARCVFKKLGLDAFTKIQSYLFSEQETFTKETIQEKTSALGLAPSDLKQCMESPEVRQEIADEVELGKSLNLQGTPTIFVNGKMAKTGTIVEALRSIIQSQLKR